MTSQGAHPGAQTDSRSRPWLFLVAWFVVLLAFWKPAVAAGSLALENELYTQLLLAPLISVALIYFHRAAIFPQSRPMAALAAPLVLLAGALYWLAAPWSPINLQNDRLGLPILAMVVLWILSFLALYGPKAAAAAFFPLGFLLFMIPLPAWLLEQIVVALQKASAEVTYFFFKLLGIPVLRHGFLFSLPGLEIEVAEECSGIRSALALLIAGMLTAHLLLDKSWKRVVFTLLTIPVAILKNGARIVILSTLSIYVDRRIIYGPLHHQGGPVFALLGLAMLFPFLWLLRRPHGPASSAPQEGAPQQV